MANPKNAKKRAWEVKRRNQLFDQQQGLCIYCQNPMLHWDFWTNGSAPLKGGRPPYNAATLEHLRDRHDPTRGVFNGQPSWAIACYDCNHSRGKQRNREHNWGRNRGQGIHSRRDRQDDPALRQGPDEEVPQRPELDQAARGGDSAE